MLGEYPEVKELNDKLSKLGNELLNRQEELKKKIAHYEEIGDKKRADNARYELDVAKGEYVKVIDYQKFSKVSRILTMSDAELEKRRSEIIVKLRLMPSSNEEQIQKYSTMSLDQLRTNLLYNDDVTSEIKPTMDIDDVGSWLLSASGGPMSFQYGRNTAYMKLLKSVASDPEKARIMSGLLERYVRSYYELKELSSEDFRTINSNLYFSTKDELSYARQEIKNLSGLDFDQLDEALATATREISFPSTVEFSRYRVTEFEEGLYQNVTKTVQKQSDMEEAKIKGITLEELYEIRKNEADQKIWTSGMHI